MSSFDIIKMCYFPADIYTGGFDVSGLMDASNFATTPYGLLQPALPGLPTILTISAHNLVRNQTNWTDISYMMHLQLGT